MSFITDAVLSSTLAARLKRVNVDITTGGISGVYWPTIVTDCNERANEIVNRLQMRGYTKAQTDLWVRGSEFQKAIGMYYCIVDGGLLDAFDTKYIDYLKTFIENLDSLVLTQNRTDDAQTMLEFPAASPVFGQGKESTAEDLFSMDPNDPRIGDPNGAQF